MSPRIKVGKCETSSFYYLNFKYENTIGRFCAEVRFRSAISPYEKQAHRISFQSLLDRSSVDMSAPTEESINSIFDSFRPQIDEHIEKWLPRKFTEQSMTEMCGPARYAYDLESATNALLVPIWDILDRGTSFNLSATSAESLRHVDSVFLFSVLLSSFPRA